MERDVYRLLTIPMPVHSQKNKEIQMRHRLFFRRHLVCVEIAVGEGLTHAVCVPEFPLWRPLSTALYCGSFFIHPCELAKVMIRHRLFTPQ